MTPTVHLLLLAFAAAGFCGSGACSAIRRWQLLHAGVEDRSLAAVNVILVAFGALCAGVVSGGTAIPAIALPFFGAGYVFMAQHIELFRIQTMPVEAAVLQGSRLHT